MKILYLLSTLKEAGPINVIYDLVKNLDRNNFTPIMATFNEYKNSVMANKFEELGVEMHYLDLNKKNWLFRGKSVLNRLLKEVQPDIVHTQCFIFTVLSGAFLQKYKRIETIHSDFLQDIKYCYGQIKGRIMCYLFANGIKNIKNNICVSKYIKEKLEKKFNNISFDYIDNGIDIEKFKSKKPKTEIRQTLNLPVDKKIFIWTGGFINLKNPKLLSKIIEKKNNNNCFFILCGDGNLKKRTEKYLKNCKNVLFTGKVKNIEDYYNASDYYISTSLTEGLPLAVIEALSCGLPVLLSDIEQHKYIFKDKNIGFIYKSQDINSMSEKFDLLINENYEIMSNNARETVVNNFSSKIMAEKYQQKYDELLKNYNPN